MAEIVSYEMQDGIARITMDDGKANALSPQMFVELNAAFDQAERDEAMIVLQGREGRFSAGFDLKVLTKGGDDTRSLLRTGFEFAARIHEFPAPVLLVSTGHTIAMGAFLAVAADYRLGVSGPFMFTCNEVKMGITMPHAAVELCRSRLSPSHFYRAMTQSEVFSPEEGVVAGFLDRVVAPEELDRAADQIAGDLRDLNRQAFASTKNRVRDVTSQTIRAAIELDDQELAALYSRA